MNQYQLPNIADIAAQQQQQQQGMFCEVIVPPTGMPTAVEVDAVQHPQPHVRITFHRPSGIDFIMLPPEQTLQLAETLRAQANAAKTGLSIIKAPLK